MTIRTRFAPSPTGYLHFGSARTALYCWLYSRHVKGQYILRIEDTDRERSTQASIDTILESLAWLGLDADEGPIFQTDRFPRYRQIVEQLMADGLAYRCTCSKARLDELREAQKKSGDKPMYDGHCREKELGEDCGPHVIRFKNPREGGVTFQDAVRGTVTVQNQEIDDLVLVRTDGVPTYNFTVVVDDHDMEISHVIRGEDHLTNTPRQINLYQSLGWPLPTFAHIPMILGQDGKRLSKRHGAVSVMAYAEEGFLPEALVNYLVRLGWSHGDQEIFSQEELIALFDIEAINKAPAKFDLEKLKWLNQHYIKQTPTNELEPLMAKQFAALGIDTDNGPTIASVIDLMKERCQTLKEMAEQSHYFYEYKPDIDLLSAQLSPGALEALEEVLNRLNALDTWTKENIMPLVKEVTKASGLKMGKVMMPLRIAVTGSMSTPSVDATLALIGKTETLRRLKTAIEAISKSL